MACVPPDSCVPRRSGEARLSFGAAFIAPAQLKETQLPHRSRSKRANPERVLNLICRPRGSGIFRAAHQWILESGARLSWQLFPGPDDKGYL